MRGREIKSGEEGCREKELEGGEKGVKTQHSQATLVTHLLIGI